MANFSTNPAAFPSHGFDARKQGFGRITNSGAMLRNTVLQGDCTRLMTRLDTGSVGFILTDPPYISRIRIPADGCNRQGAAMPWRGDRRSSLQCCSFALIGFALRGTTEMNLEDLQTFVEVADSEGTSTAARRLGLSKSIVSRRLFRVEAELGIQLLAGSTRGAALTEAGEAFGFTQRRPVPRSTRPGKRFHPPVSFAGACE